MLLLAYMMYAGSSGHYEGMSLYPYNRPVAMFLLCIDVISLSRKSGKIYLLSV